MIKNIIILISLWFNILLYFWIIDVLQYKNIVDKWIQTWKDIATSEEVKNLWNSISSKLSKTYWDDFNEIKNTINNKIKENWNVSLEEVQKEFPELSIDDFNEIKELSK